MGIWSLILGINLSTSLSPGDHLWGASSETGLHRSIFGFYLEADKVIFLKEK